jgi:hypothetical protein
MPDLERAIEAAARALCRLMGIPRISSSRESRCGEAISAAPGQRLRPRYRTSWVSDRVAVEGQPALRRSPGARQPEREKRGKRRPSGL